MVETINEIVEMIPHSKPTIGEEEALASAEIVKSGQIAQGDEVERFEADFVGCMGGGFAAAVGSGTAALHLVLAAMEIGKGDEVVIPSYVCTALMNAVNYVGATPIIADIAPLSHNLAPSDAETRITQQTKAVVVPHMFGEPADMPALSDFNVSLIEDCAQAIGGSCQGKRLGTIGNAAIFSFYATKVITTGEGGMVYSSEKGFIDRIKDLRDYDGREDYKVRFNFKMTDIQAAIGRVQLTKLGSFIERRREIANIYFDHIRSIDVTLPSRDMEHTFYRFPVRLKCDVDTVIESMSTYGVRAARPVYKPLHRYLGLNGFPETEAAWEKTLSIPIYPSLTDQQIERIALSLQKALNR